MKCPFKALIDSAYANETARAKGSQTGSTDPILKEERRIKFEARRDSINLSIEYLKDMFYKKQNEKCPVSGIVLDINDKHIRDKADWRWCLAPSLDRINNSIGYVKGNVQITCRFVNVGFKDFSGDRDIVSDILFKKQPRPCVGIENILI